MNTQDGIEIKAASLGLEKGYYLLLMAILDQSEETGDGTLHSSEITQMTAEA